MVIPNVLMFIVCVSVYFKYNTLENGVRPLFQETPAKRERVRFVSWLKAYPSLLIKYTTPLPQEPNPLGSKMGERELHLRRKRKARRQAPAIRKIEEKKKQETRLR